jgi:striatin 1/3/4
MAWQSPSAMNAGGAGGGGDGNAPAGTEYTLQGEPRPRTAYVTATVMEAC